MLIKGVAFDLYGTLLSADTYKIGQVYLDFLKKLGLTPREKAAAFDILLTKNFDDFDSILKHLNSPSCNVTQEEVSDFETRLSALLKQVRIFSSVYPILKILHQLNYKIVVISNISTPFKKPFEGLIGKNVTASVFSCDFGQRKPNRNIFLEGCAKIDLQPNEVIMLGDSIKSDYYGSKKAGLHPILIDRKPTSHEFTDEKTCINSLNQLLYHLN